MKISFYENLEWAGGNYARMALRDSTLRERSRATTRRTGTSPIKPALDYAARADKRKCQPKSLSG